MCAAAPSVARVSAVAVAELGRSSTEKALPRWRRVAHQQRERRRIPPWCMVGLYRGGQTVKIYKPVGLSGICSFENTKPVFIPNSLDDLRGPTEGSVTLPLYIDWTPSNTYDLSDEVSTCTMYETVLREAKAEDDLSRFLDLGLLVRMWSSLRLPDFIRDSWERSSPQLRQC